MVVKASESAFTTGDDPCTGTGGFAGAVPPICDSDGSALILQSFPNDGSAGGLGPHQIIDPSSYVVPGFDNLGQFNIDPLSIMNSAVSNQQVNGAKAPDFTKSSEFVNQIVNADPSSVNLGETCKHSLIDVCMESADLFGITVVFSLPVCDFSLNPAQSDAGVQVCGTQSNPSLCQFYQQMLIGCPQQQIGGQAWPYPLTIFGSILIQ